MESPLQIKRSMGIQRAKDDRIDAIKIAEYARKNHLSIRKWEKPRKCVEELATLYSIRRRLLKVKKVLRSSLPTETYFLSTSDRLSRLSYINQTLNAINDDLEKVEQAAAELIKSDKRLDTLRTLIMSVPRIGEVTAAQIIIHTNEFKGFASPKSFASFCGVAPFPWKSGTNIIKRTRVSHFARKELKALLHMAAVGFARNPVGTLGRYYTRKVNKGKNKMSILNAISNKLIHRIFSCVRNNAIYEDN